MVLQIVDGKDTANQRFGKAKILPNKIFCELQSGVKDESFYLKFGIFLMKGIVYWNSIFDLVINTLSRK